jgi:hypothetical protein
VTSMVNWRVALGRRNSSVAAIGSFFFVIMVEGIWLRAFSELGRPGATRILTVAL